MKTKKNLERLQRLNELIKQEKTGTPKELAKAFNISERTLHHLIENLKEWEAPICYSRRRKTYYYCDCFDIQLSVSLKVISGGKQTQIYEGSYFLNKNLFTARFMHKTNLFYCVKKYKRCTFYTL